MKRALTALLLAAAIAGCASPDASLWPPARGAPSHPIIVSLDTWHAVIAFPQTGSADLRGPGTGALSSALGPRRFEEWGYAEQAWYLEGRQGFTGMLRVLFMATPGVVEVGRYDRVWAERTPQPPADRFTLHLSDEGYRRLRRYLESSLASDMPIRTIDGSTFYPAVRSYHVLAHQCHQYAAQGLREAGLPVSAFWAFGRAAFAAQLERAVRMEEDLGSSSAQDRGSSVTPSDGGDADRIR